MITDVIDKTKAKRDSRGIWTTNMNATDELKVSQKVWEEIYNFNLQTLKKDRDDFNRNKLQDHVAYIDDSYAFSKHTVYLEIGCGPSYIGEYLMKKYDCTFIGVDFNYEVLEVLKKYLDQKGFKKYILVHADINSLPLKNQSVDYIYGGGVIEHFRDTSHILRELYRVLKKGGVCFNTVPAFNVMWLVRFWNNIPTISGIRKVFEFIHVSLLNNKLLDRYHGYELSFTNSSLVDLHKKAKFKKITSGAFAFHPSERKVSNPFLRSLYFFVTSKTLMSPVYFISATK